MSEMGDLERRYRRLLAWYPRSFRREREEEMVAVLLAGARDGQRRPGLLESADLIRSAVGMRLGRFGPKPEAGPWADALAMFSFLAPLLLALADALEVAVPYRLPPVRARWHGFLPPWFAAHPQLGGLSLLHYPDFDIAVGCHLVIAVLVLAGLRRTALAAVAASILCWVVTRYLTPQPLQVLSASVFMLEAAALFASPGPRRGRQLTNWGHWIVLLLTAAAVQAATLADEATGPIARMLTGSRPEVTGYLVASAALATAAAALAVGLRTNWRLLLFLAVLFYPFVLQLTYPRTSSSDNLIGVPTPVHLVLLFAPPLLLACGVIVAAVMPRRHRARLSIRPDKPGLT